MVQLLTSIISGCKLAAPNPLFKNLVSVSQAIGKKGKNKISLQRGGLQRATAFIVPKVQLSLYPKCKGLRGLDT